MSISFSGGELIHIAIEIERRGIAFYDTMAKSADSAQGRALFSYLADMEREHRRVFQGMLDEVGDYRPSPADAEEHAAYLRALADSAVFTDEFLNGELAAVADSDTQAVELGVSAEKDSILFYYEMKDILPRQAQPAVDKILAEEKAHLGQLSELKKELASL